MNIVAIVQARMGSTRLPGKVLKNIVGKPVLWHIVNRLRAARLVNRVVIAAPDNEADKPIIKFARENGVDCYAGSEHDLLDRLYQAANKFKADIVVWITADCPLVDPEVVDKVVEYYLDNADSFDVVCAFTFMQKQRPYPDGLDVLVVPFKVIEKMWQEVKDPFKREWFTTNFYDPPEKYRIGTLPGEMDLSHMRWTLDYEDDLIFITEIYKRLYQEDKIFLMDDVLDLLRLNPELMEINKGHTAEEAYQKALETKEGEG